MKKKLDIKFGCAVDVATTVEVLPPKKNLFWQPCYILKKHVCKCVTSNLNLEALYSLDSVHHNFSEVLGSIA